MKPSRGISSVLFLFWAGFSGGWGPARSFAAEPLMDISLFVTNRVGAVNAAKQGNFTQALQGEQAALKIAQDQYGPTSLSLVPILNDEAILQWRLADYRGSEEDFKWGLALLERALGPDDPKLADPLGLLAGLYLDLNRLEEAELLMERALALREKGRSPDPDALSHSQYLLGRIEAGLKKDSDAQSLFHQAQGSLEKTPHPDPAFSIRLWEELAESYSAQKDFSKAGSCHEKALQLAQKEFPSDSAEVVEEGENLADFYLSQGAGDKARPLYETALKTARRFVGTNYDFQSVPYIRRLIRAYQGLGDGKSALDLWEKIISTESKVLGSQHPLVALDRMRSAQTESSLGQKGKAQKELQESLAALERFFPPDHPLVLQAREFLEESRQN